MSSHSADQTSSGIAGLTTTAAGNSPAMADDVDVVTGEVPSVSGAYIYGYDSAGDPTLTDADYYGISDGKLSN